MRKCAGELRVGDIWTERRKDRAARSYRVIAWYVAGYGNRSGMATVKPGV